jgi:hypothetical protein
MKGGLWTKAKQSTTSKCDIPPTVSRKMQAVLSSSPSNQATAPYVLGMSRVSLSNRKITLFYTEQAGPGDNAPDLHSVVPPVQVLDGTPIILRLLWFPSVTPTQISTNYLKLRKDSFLPHPLNSMALVRERTIPTEWPPPVGEVSVNFCG